jgi:hypothetical protein
MIRAALLLIPLLFLIGCGGSDWDEKQSKKEIEREGGQADVLTAQDHALTQTRIQALLDDTEATLSTLNELDSEIKKWNDLAPGLLTNDRGRRLASNPAYIEAYLQFTEEPRPGSDRVASARRQLQSIRDILTKALKSKTPALGTNEAKFRSEITAISTTALADLESYRQDRTSLEALLADPQAQSAPVTLDQAIATRRVELERARAEEIASRRDAAYKAHTDSIASLEEAAEHERQASQERDLATRALRAQAEDPTIQAKFAPFIQKGHTYLEAVIYSKSPTFRTINGPAQPLSYNALLKGQALENLTVFVNIACSRETNGRIQNDRALWRFPTSDPEWEEYRERQDLFKKLAPVWRDMGILAP